MRGLYLTDEIRAVLALNPTLIIHYSGGKDSETMARLLVQAFGKLLKIYFLFCDTGWEYDDDENWPSTERWARQRAEHYGYPLHVVRHPTMTILDNVVRRGWWPSDANRWCTSQWKTGPGKVFVRNLTDALVINCLGIRSDESRERANKPPWQLDGRDMTVTRARNTGKPRTSYTWYPIKEWETPEIYAYLARENVPLHPVYAFLPRLSCQVCIYHGGREFATIRKNNPKGFWRAHNLELSVGKTIHPDGNMVELADAYEASLVKPCIPPPPPSLHEGRKTIPLGMPQATIKSRKPRNSISHNQLHMWGELPC